MELISFRGLNCYQSCVVSVAHDLGADYLRAFSTLWSETDFLYEEKYRIYSTKRLLVNLKALGVEVRNLLIDSREDTQKQLDLLQCGESAIVGIDAYHIPWSPIYMLSHDPHFLIVRKENAEWFACFDPSYGTNDAQMNAENLVINMFELYAVKSVEKQPLHATAREEAAAILQGHPETIQNIIKGVHAHIDKEELLMRGRYVDEMIKNRYLYRRYLDTVSSAAIFFDEDYFMRWKAVKNGLLKAYLLKKNENILIDIISRLECVMRKELELAKAILEREYT